MLSFVHKKLFSGCTEVDIKRKVRKIKNFSKKKFSTQFVLLWIGKKNQEKQEHCTC